MPEINYLWTPPAPVSLPVRGTGARFPVNRLFFVGRNYQAHAIEMGSSVDKASMRPMYFTKSSANLALSGGTAPYPPETRDYHHEMELVVAIGEPGFRVSESSARRMIYGYACGLDMTRRDLQTALKDKGRPWELGKSFDRSAPIGPLHPASAIGHPSTGRIWLTVNGVLKQQGDLADLIWSVPETIAHLSRYFELRPGDLIFTGTPEGVGPVVRGDLLTGGVAGVGELSVRIL